MTIKQRLGKLLIPGLPVTRHIFDHFRLELNAIYVRTLHKISPVYLSRIKKLKKKKDILVNLGCGPYGLPDDWINLDLFPIKNVYLRTDCRKWLPLGDNSSKGIHVEMFLEHLDPFEELPVFLKECYRSLQPGGVLRVIVPDAELFLKAYAQEGWDGLNAISYGFEDWSKEYETKMDALNHVFLQVNEHYGGWSYERLKGVLEKAGFATVRRVAYKHGEFPGGAIDREYHRQNGLYVEAVK
ncbi:MAG TPA: methyltransferase domain-containing protein [Puia sp.]|nr:methyltransferase domain-containing protein [Puia sp.]